ncbi:hypothetical protein EGW08_016207, partial [Elysia chlorotica]
MATGTRLMQEISDQFLNCKICFESFREPKTLTCLHTFCLDCLQQQYEQEASNRSSRFTLYTSRSVTCPLCRKKTELPAGGVRRLPDNFLVCNLNQVLAKRTVSRVPPCDICASVRARSVDACSKCLDCTKVLCKTCVDLHLGTKVTQQHSIIDLEGEKDIVCKVHTEEMVKFYCEPCRACICVVCAFQEHKDHDVLSFSDSYAKYRSVGGLEGLLEQCKTRAQEVSSRLSVIDKYETVVKDVRTAIRDLAISSITKVRARERELMKRIDDVYGDEVQAFVDSRPALQESLDDLQNTVQFTDIMLRDKSVELLLIKRDIEAKMAQLLEPQLDKVPSDPALYNIRFVPGDVMLGKLSFGGEENGESYQDEGDEIDRLKKKELNKLMVNGELSENDESSNGDSAASKATSPPNDPDVITNCSQTEKFRSQDSATSMSNNMGSSSSESNLLGHQDGEVKQTESADNKHSSDDNLGLNNSKEKFLLANGTKTSAPMVDTSSVLESVGMSRAQRRAEREARKKLLGGVNTDRAPAPDIVPSNATNTSPPSVDSHSSGAFVYTPGRAIRSRKIQTEISALDVQIGASNTDREFVQSLVQAELVAERMKQEREEMKLLSPRLRDRFRRVRTAEIGVMTDCQVRIVPEMIDKETTSDSVQLKDVGTQDFRESSTNYTQTPVVRLENSGMCTDREGQAEKCTGTLSIDVQDKDTCTALVMSESKATWTEGVATSDRATATMLIKHHHRAVGTTPTSTGSRGCQVNPQVSAMYTNTPVVTWANMECQASPPTTTSATAPDPDLEANCPKHEVQAINLNVTDSSVDFLTPPQSPPPRIASVETCDRASDAFYAPTSNKCVETLTVKTVSSSTETAKATFVDREMGTEERKTLDQWTETYSPTMINTGVTPPRPDTLDVGVATTVVITDEQATITDIKSFRDTQTETALVVCDGETLTDPVAHSDAQTSVEVYTESRQCETNPLKVADETSMTDYYNPWEAVDTNTQASQCDTAILRTKETNTTHVKRKTKEAQTYADPAVCPECGFVDINSADPDMTVSELQSCKAFKNSSTIPRAQISQDVGTMAISCTACSHENHEMSIQTFQPEIYDKSSATSSDPHDPFLARALSREYHDVATSTDSLPLIGLLSEIQVDELIVLPDDSASELVSQPADCTFTGERVIMVDDETSMDPPQSVETGTQTFASLPDGGDVDSEGIPVPLALGGIGIAYENETQYCDNIDTLDHRRNISLSGSDTTRLDENCSASNKLVCSSRNCPSRQEEHLVSIGVNTAPKLTFEKETGTSLEHYLSGNKMTIYVRKIDKGTSTSNRVRIVYGRASGIGKKTKSVDKITMTSRVEQREVGVETDVQQMDGKITECISKLRSVSQRLNSPSSPPSSPPSKEAFFEKNCTGGEHNSSIVSTAGKGSESNRQANVKNLLEKTNAILRRKDPSPTRKPQPITTLKTRTLSDSNSLEQNVLMPNSAADSVLSNLKDVNPKEPQHDTGYSSKSLPRGFTSERRSGTVRMGSQPLSPPARLPLNRYNSAPGRIATVPAQTLLIKTNCAGGKLSRSPSPRLSPKAISTNPPENPSSSAVLVTGSKSLDSKALPSFSTTANSVMSKTQKRHPLPSITETRTPSSCSDNSTSSLHSSGSAASKRQSIESAAGKKSSPGANKKHVNGAQLSPDPSNGNKTVSKSGPKSPQVIPKRLANLSIGAPTLHGNNASPSVKEAPKSPALGPRATKREFMKSPSPKPMKKEQTAGLVSNQPSSTETIQSNTSTETVDGTKPKKSSGIGFMQRFLSKKKKSSEVKKEPVAVNTKLCPPTAEAVAALSSLPAPVPAAPTESYAHVPLQHPPHHYVPTLEVKPLNPIHKPSAYVYVNQRLISIQQDNVEEKKASRDG